MSAIVTESEPPGRALSPRDGDFDDPGERKLTTKWASGGLGDELPLCTPEEVAALSPARRALADHPMVDELAFFDAILEVLAAEYAIDESRIYASGFSNGGGMSSWLAAHRSDRLAGVAAAAGLLDDDFEGAADRPLPVVISMGELDEGFAERLGVDALPLDESLLELPLLAAVVERYQALLQLDPDYTFETNVVNDRTVARLTWATSTVGADNELQLVVIEGLGPQYPNGRNHPIAIVDPLWTFFSRFSLE